MGSAVAGRTVRPREASGSLLVDDVRIVDGTGAPVQCGSSILVKDGVIAYVGPPTEATAAWMGTRLSGAGRTVVPGLIDLHIHSTLDADMRCYVKNGVTTVRYGGIDSTSVDDLRRRIRTVGLRAPRILSCGPMIDTAPPSWPQWARVVVDPGEARLVALELLDHDDLDGLFVVHGVTTDILRPIVDAAHERGRPVVGQLWYPDGRECAELGVDQLDNTSRIVASTALPSETLIRPGAVPDRLALLARAWAQADWDLTMPIVESMAEAGVAYCPTLVVWEYLAGIGREELESDQDYLLFSEADHLAFAHLAEQMNGTWTRDDAYFWRVALDNRYEWIRRFHELGGVVVVGTDMQYGGIQFHRELACLEDCGLSRSDVIAAATGHAARAAGLAGSIGTVQEGKNADFLVLNADPLEGLANLRAVDLVVQDGVPTGGDGSP